MYVGVLTHLSSYEPSCHQARLTCMSCYMCGRRERAVRSARITPLNTKFEVE